MHPRPKHPRDRVAAIALSVFALLYGGHSVNAGDLQTAIDTYRQAQKEFVKGNPQPFKDVCSHSDDASIFGGWGGYEKGWAAQVEKRYDWASARFASGEDERKIENISLVVTPEMAYSVDIERSKISLANSKEVRTMALRVTTIFRLENGDWKVIHRHADPLVEVLPSAATSTR